MTLEFGTNQQNSAMGIREGADVYFECNIKANPWVYKVTWQHNVSELMLYRPRNKKERSEWENGMSK